MRTPLCIILLIANALATHNSSAQEWPPHGKYLEKMCQSISATDMAFCDGFILGVLSGRLAYASELARKTGQAQNFGHCLYGRSIADIELRSIVLSYIARNRARVAEIDAGYAVSLALAEAYPCKN